ncbi:MAG: ArgE/DapE family deacylase [Nitrososphaeria archaeon]|jgi:succinyl-diaminopimelate desuccinylase
MQDIDLELNVLKKMVAVNSDSITKSGYKECANIIADEAEKLGLEVEIFDSKAKSSDKLARPNVVATLNVEAPKTFLGIAHYDIVPPGEGWDYDPFKMKVDSNKAYGRGTADDKGSIAALLGAARKVGKNSKINFKILITQDEEVGGELGLGYLIDDVGIKGDGALIVDAGTEFLSIGASGIVNGTVTVKGIQGHAGSPHKCLNALQGMGRLIVELQKFQDFREHKLSSLDAPPGSIKEKIWGRFSVTMLKSGVKSNIIPGEAEATFDMRLLPEEDSVRAQNELKDFLNKADLGDPRFRIDLKFDLTGGNYYTDPRLPLVQEFKKAIETVTGENLPLAAELGANDGKFTNRKGIPTISYGPLAEDTHYHGVNEFVWLKDLKKVRDVITKYLESQ